MASIDIQGHCIAIKGALSFETVPGLWQESEKFMQTLTSNLNIDLANVTTSDSAGLALLLEYKKVAQRQNKATSFQNMPAQLSGLASVMGVSDILS